MINGILIYYRLRTLGGNLLHKNIVTMIICSQYGFIITYTSLLSKSLTLAPSIKGLAPSLLGCVRVGVVIPPSEIKALFAFHI